MKEPVDPPRIVNFPAQPERVVVRRKEYDDCRHFTTEIDLRHRTLTCRVCKMKLDPLTMLVEYVQWLQTQRYTLLAIREHEKKETERRERRIAKRDAKKGPGPHL